ncbi:MAG: FHA domain-containing protein [Chloroflexota bacterium]
MAGKFQFIMRSGPTPGATYPLEGESLTIGREASNHIQINDAEISRRHSRLQFQGGKYVIEDLGSTNGTYVNGQRLAAPYVLKPGDVVSFGEQIVLAFEASDFDPAATIATSRTATTVAPPPPPPAAYAGQMPSDFVGQPVKRRNLLPLIVVAGMVVLVCACVMFFVWVDYTSNWCNVLPILEGCP